MCVCGTDFTACDVRCRRGYLSPLQDDWSIIWPGNEDKYKKPQSNLEQLRVLFWVFFGRAAAAHHGNRRPSEYLSTRVFDACDHRVHLQLRIIHKKGYLISRGIRFFYVWATTCKATLIA